MNIFPEIDYSPLELRVAMWAAGIAKLTDTARQGPFFSDLPQSVWDAIEPTIEPCKPARRHFRSSPNAQYGIPWQDCWAERRPR